MQWAFKLYDKDCGGAIDISEMVEAVGTLHAMSAVELKADILFLKHYSCILIQSSTPVPGGGRPLIRKLRCFERRADAVWEMRLGKARLGPV